MLKAFDVPGPPPTATLVRRFLDGNRRDFGPEVLNCVAHMILRMDAPRDMMHLALELLVGQLGASRADAGFVQPAERLYEPIVTYESPAHEPVPTGCSSTSYPNRAQVFRRTWTQAQPVSSDDVLADPLLTDCRLTYAAIQSRALLLQRLTDGGQPLGLVSIDFTDGAHVWKTAELVRVHAFCTTFLAPMAAIAQRWHLPERHDCARPTVAELDAIRLAAAGLGSKRIAARLGKSVHTIENQLRSARQRLDVPNLAALVHRCEPWL